MPYLSKKYFIRLQQFDDSLPNSNADIFTEISRKKNVQNQNEKLK